ncbi:MAG: MmcQ/YjbR family DNA-binding protein [Dokdonella sp.]
MNPDDFRRLALALPEAVESAHLGTPDFRVRGKIFATLGAGAEPRCVVKFTLEQQEVFMRVDPAAFEPVKGGWGRKGWTHILLSSAQPPIVSDALALAWRNTAPKKLAAMLPPNTD